MKKEKKRKKIIEYIFSINFKQPNMSKGTLNKRKNIYQKFQIKNTTPTLLPVTNLVCTTSWSVI